MGTTLTGTTPQDTYDSLIKVTDNGPISGTAKYLSDGLGNDSALALSTGEVGISITNTNSVKLGITGNSGLPASSGTAQTGLLRLKASNNATLDIGADHVNAVGWLQVTDVADLSIEYNLVLQPNGGDVGIGTSSPTTDSKLHVLRASSGVSARTDLGGTIIAEGSTRAGLYILTSGTDAGSYGSIWWGNGHTNTDASIQVNNSTREMSFSVADAERFRITTNGITFNGDTAAANALDDYEEGTWTMGVSFGGASVGVTTSSNTGTYTKIGRQVTVNGYLALTSKGSSTGDAQITGLPFAIGNSSANYSVPSLWLDDITFANVYSGYGVVGDTKFDLFEFTEAGVFSSLTNADFADTSRIMISFTYFV